MMTSHHCQPVATNKKGGSSNGGGGQQGAPPLLEVRQLPPERGGGMHMPGKSVKGGKRGSLLLALVHELLSSLCAHAHASYKHNPSFPTT